MAWHRWRNAILSLSQYNKRMIFRFFTQFRRAFTRENPLWGSLVTFLTNELGTECTYIGIIREDLREGMCEEGTGCDQAKHVHNQSCGEAPWVLPAPGKKYVASNAYKTHIKDNLVTRNTVSLPLPKRGPATQEMRMHRATPALTTGGCKRFLREWNSFISSLLGP